MNRFQRTISKNSISEKQQSNTLWIAGSLLLTMLMLFCLPAGVMASQKRFVLDFNDSQIRGRHGGATTISLKRALKEQHPWLNVSALELKKVILVAKSKKGRGAAGLRVGKWGTEMSEVGGSPRTFHDNGRRSFDRVGFSNPSHNSWGPWQLGLRGNFIVRKVVLIVDEHGKRDRYSKWNRHHR